MEVSDLGEGFSQLGPSATLLQPLLGEGRLSLRMGGEEPLYLAEPAAGFPFDYLPVWGWLSH